MLTKTFLDTSAHVIVRTVAAAALVLLPGVAAAQPDLVPQIFGVVIRTENVPAADVAEGCAGGTSNRRLIRYGLRTRNIGDDDLVLGPPGCPDCFSNPGAACANTLFVCSPAHGHVHFEDFAHAELVDDTDTVLVEGRKSGFCILDSECATPHYTCNSQGLTAGCADIYTATTPCQYIDITDVTLPAGTYTIRVTVDPENQMVEANEGNNTTTAAVVIGGGTPTPAPTFTPPPLCGAVPRSGCRQAGASEIKINDSADARRDRIAWSWRRANTIKSAFGNPLTVTGYALCLYDDSEDPSELLTSSTAPPAGTCGRRPCWRATGMTGFSYVNSRGSSDGIVRILLKRGERADAKIIVRGKGTALSLPSLPLSASSSALVQLVNSDGECWEAQYSAPAVRNTDAVFKDSSP